MANIEKMSDSELIAYNTTCINNTAKFNNLQMAMKILSNSAYGAVGNPHFRFYKIEIAEAITLSGQLILKWTMDRVNKFLNLNLKTNNVDYCRYGDTDSIYIEFKELVRRMKKETELETVDELDKFMKKILLPYIETVTEDLAEYMSAYENRMFFEREVIAPRGVWTAKKRYMLNVWDSEGVRYKEPKMKVMGLESKKSSTPQICRDKLKESYKIVLEKDEKILQAFVAEFYDTWKALSPDEIAFPRGVNNLGKYSDSQTIYTKGTPKHVRASLLYNHYIKKKGLDKIHPLITEGEKIKFIELNPKNYMGEGVIGFTNFLPEELGLHEFIDYEFMFDKAFIQPLKGVLDAVGWNHEEIATLDDFFA